jgi:hypothetical protein
MCSGISYTPASLDFALPTLELANNFGTKLADAAPLSRMLQKDDLLIT